MKRFLKSSNLLIVSLVLALIYVPIKIEGLSLTFWVFLLDFKSLGEKGVLWHFYKVAQEIDMRYFLLQALIVYFLCRFCMFIVYMLRNRRSSKHQHNNFS
jgi:hypothetical protein